MKDIAYKALVTKGVHYLVNGLVVAVICGVGMYFAVETNTAQVTDNKKQIKEIKEKQAADTRKVLNKFCELAILLVGDKKAAATLCKHE